jgi:TP901 family phage tail tape measure protein
MVDISKVTNLSADALERLKKNSFDAASAFGRTSQDYLKAVAEFSRAGYENQAEGLSKLSLLAQNVGELTAEQANQFLLATDAAYKYAGSQQELGRVLDGVNQIDNKFATSIQKVSEGISVAASISSNASVGVDELAAAVGTMTSVTQRSGNEAGRAFRSILMNIRQIKGETDDGEIIDDKALSLSAAALDSVGIKVHELRNGVEELRNPMDVLKQLSSMWGSLSSMKQAPIIEALGGKYRGNQLVALLENWTTYEKMLAEYAGAAGSAMTENEKRMSSWKTKIAQFTNAVSNMWNNAISTDFVKFVINAGTTTVNLVDKIGLLPIVIGAATLAFSLFSKTAFTGIMTAVAQSVATLAVNIGMATTAATILGTALGTIAPLAVVGIVLGLIKVIDILNVSMSELSEQVNKSFDDTESNIKKIKELGNQYEGLANKTSLTRDEKLQLIDIERELNTRFGKTTEAIDLQNGSLDTNIDKIDALTKKEAERFQILNKVAYELAKRTLDANNIYNVGMPTGNRPFVNLEDAIKHFENIVKNTTNSNSTAYEQARIQLEKLYKEYDTATDIVSKYEGYESLLGKTVEQTNTPLGEQPEIVEEVTKSFNDLTKEISNIVSDIKDLNDIQSDLEKGNKLTADSVLDLVTKYPQLLDYLYETKDGYELEAGAIGLVRQALIDEKIVALETSANITEDMKTKLSLRLEAYGIEIESIKSLNDARNAALSLSSGNFSMLPPGATSQIYENDLKVLESIAKINSLKDLLNKGIKSSSSGSTSTPDIYTAEINQFQAYEDALADINTQLERNEALQKLANNDDKIALLSKRVELLKQEQKALHDIAEARRQAISQNVSKLQSQGFDISYDSATNQLAIRNWQHINDLKGKNIEATNKLRKATEDLLQNTVKLNEANQDASKEWYSVEGSINDVNNSIAEINKSIAETITNTVKSQVSDLKQGLEQIMDAEEEAHQKRLDNIEEEKKKFDDYMDDKINQLDREKAASDYSDDVNEITNELNKLQTERAKYSMAVASGATEAISIVADLDEQISEKKKQLSEKQEDREYDLRKQNLQDQKESYDDDLEAKKDRENKKYDAVKASYDKLLNDISTFTDSTTTLNTSMVDSMIQDYNNLSSQFTGITQQMANVFQNTFLSKLSNARQEIQNLTGLSGNNTSSIISQMKSNSIAWGKASPEDKKRLADENMELGTSIGWKRDPQSGIWYKADGTRAYGNGTDDVISMVGEHGRELRTLNPNGKDSIIPNGLTERLVSLANNPMNFMSKFMHNINIPALSPIGGSFNMGNIVLNINGSINDQNIKRVNDNITTQLKSVFTKAGIIKR